MRDFYCTLDLIAKSKKVSLRKLAEATGVAYTTVHRIARNDYDRIDAGVIEKICKFFEIVPGDLLRLHSAEATGTLSSDDLLKMHVEQCLMLQAAEFRRPTSQATTTY
ncbi:helix-turn-helix transcriptional regulator [Thermosynechococcaceae cyanobacterium BACA0444]|uniref:Helix-turn-helix transcriptional regulator n=1 Tax=Pseudocalidococcus azoricus BACA0444 TaxID=2918990 RepID=A0AAE4FU84_9CYAN|nr:helix-turn-helix transcriptional regulator [Pseudocalidococcus azoricus]MDS3862474.1 helix-turn-helix transcriptional regulator [Pseudocalidococcus azoricus BACA0444]